ncbi:MGMT family protein [Halospeciosus flavus]|uniref:MGMT family protein n=1 Tax=Halospeciosus flavus TaxID=3032283 RepID=A0ABD5Z5S3_9EURY|nr:MGMT family protein [Halospeciosus flavus]
MDAAGIYAAESSYLGRYVQIGVAGEKLISVSFPSTPDEDAEEEHELLDRLLAYLEGVEDDFDDVDVGLTLSGEKRDVLEAARDIPYGEQVTVEQLARMTPGLDPEDEEDDMTVREALAENPVPIVVPDHRVRDGPSAAPPEVEQKLRNVEGL